MTQKNDSQPRIPDKKHFRIGEIGRIVGVPTSVLRYWETEFPGIKPRRTSSGQRLYHRSEIELILKIKTLLYDKKFTIKGARNYLEAESEQKPSQKPSSDCMDVVGLVQTELKNIRDLLK